MSGMIRMLAMADTRDYPSKGISRLLRRCAKQLKHWTCVFTIIIITMTSYASNLWWRHYYYSSNKIVHTKQWPTHGQGGLWEWPRSVRKTVNCLLSSHILSNCINPQSLWTLRGPDTTCWGPDGGVCRVTIVISNQFNACLPFDNASTRFGALVSDGIKSLLYDNTLTLSSHS